MKGKKKLYFAVICLAMFAANFANSAQGVLLSDYIGFYRLESASQGLMSTAQSLGCVIACILIIILAGRVKRYHLIMFSAFASTMAMFLIGLVPAFLLFLAVYALFGAGYASTSNISSSLTSELFKSSASAMGMLHAAFGLGGLLGPLVLRSIQKNLCIEWNIVCVCAGGVLFIALTLYLAALRNVRPVLLEMRESQTKVTAESLKAFFAKKQNILLVIATFGYMAFQNGVSVWIARFTDMELGAAELGALTLSMFWVGNTVARLTVTRIKLSTETLFSAGCALSALFFAVGLIIGNAYILLVCVILCGLTSGACIPQIYHLGCIWNEQNSLLATSVLAITMFLSAMVTAPLTAVIADGRMLSGMFTIVAYAALGAAALLPVALKKKV